MIISSNTKEKIKWKMKVFPSLFPEETIHVNKCQKFDCRGWDDLREQHRNIYIIKCETDCQSRLDA